MIKITKEEKNDFILTPRYGKRNVTVISITYFNDTGSSYKLVTYLCSHVKYRENTSMFQKQLVIEAVRNSCFPNFENMLRYLVFFTKFL